MSDELVGRLRQMTVHRPDDRSTTRYEPYVIITEKERDEIADALSRRDADAERYRWLREPKPYDRNINVCNWEYVKWPSEQPYAMVMEELDAAIDQARKG